MYVEEQRHFLACLRGEATSMQDVRAARDILQVALAAKTSLDAGTPMSLDMSGVA